jgi:hypothetical protein
MVPVALGKRSVHGHQLPVEFFSFSHVSSSSRKRSVHGHGRHELDADSSLLSLKLLGTENRSFMGSVGNQSRSSI